MTAAVTSPGEIMKIIVRSTVLLMSLAVIICAAAAGGKPLSNADVTKMVKAGISDDTIVQMIHNGPADLDTSVEAVITLKSQGASKAVLDAVVASKEPRPSSNQADNPGLAAQVGNFESIDDVFLVEGSKRTRLSKAGGKAIGGQMGMFRSVTWLVFPGRRAEIRTTSDVPTFDVALPEGMLASEVIRLAKPDVDGESRRIEQYVQGLFVTAKTLDKRYLPVSIEKSGNTAGGRLVKYRVKPLAPLPAGEYLFEMASSASA